MAPSTIPTIAQNAQSRHVAQTKHVLTILGARPNFVKHAALTLQLRLADAQLGFVMDVVHTGQHYDEDLSDRFFQELPLDPPLHHLGIGGTDQAKQFGLILERLTPILRADPPAAILVYGDTTTTAASALAATYLDIPVAHVEAGERTYHRVKYPEEVNRVITDHIAALELVVGDKARDYLRLEGIPPERIEVVGDLMFDLFRWAWPRLDELAGDEIRARKGDEYILATLHRAENTDDLPRLRQILTALDGSPVPVVMPAHPRLRERMTKLGWEPQQSLELISPVGYFDLLYLLQGATSVVTDSGGVIREALFAQTPSIVPLAATPWGEAISSGWATLANDPIGLAAILKDPPTSGVDFSTDAFGDGNAGRNIVAALNRLVERDGDWDTAWQPR